MKTVLKVLKYFFDHLNIFGSLWAETKFAVKAFYPIFLIIVIPLIYPSLMSVVYSNQSVVERKVVILDQDNSALSRAFLMNLDATQGAFIKNSVSTVDEGIEAVMSRDADAFMIISEDFSKRIKRIEQGSIKAYVYATNMMIYASVMTAAQETVLSMNTEIALERITSPNGITGDRAMAIVDPVRYDKTILHAPTLAYASFLCPILFLLVIQQMSLIVPGFSIGYRREKDPEFAKKHLWLLDYFGHFIFFLPFVALAAVFIYGVLCPMFGWPSAPFSQMLFLSLLVSVANFPIAAILMSVARDKYTTFQLVLALSVPCFMISGYVWPLYSMPGWVASVSDWFVINPVGFAMRKIVFKGMSISDIGPELNHILRIFIAYTIAAIIIVHRGIFIRNFRRLRDYLKTRKNAKSQDDSDDAEQPSEVPAKTPSPVAS